MRTARSGDVLVVGLGGTGVAVVDFVRASGRAVTVVEDRPQGNDYAERAAHARAAGAHVVEAPGPDAAPALVAASGLVVPSPGVRPTHPVLVAARAAGVPVRAEIDLAAELLAARANSPSLVAVTGTNGKTTVTALIAHMLETGGRRAVAAGNIGRPLLDVVADDADVVVAEVSSFQLELTTEAFSPDVAVLLNVAADHIDWHGSRAAYVAAKAKVFVHQRPDAVLVANVDDPVVAELAAAAPGRVVEVRAGGESHDVLNARAATAAATALGVDPECCATALATFSPPAHRIQLVAEVDGVRYVDDSKATNPHATESALAQFAPVVLIAGGRNKDLDLGVLGAHAATVRAVVAIGESADDVAAAFAGTDVPVVRAASMRDAVQSAAQRARRGDVVLLSPACASFDWYGGYAERGDDFVNEVEALKGRTA